MRIVIDVDGVQETVLLGSSARGAGAVGAEAEEATDGGGGPSGGVGGIEVADVAVVTDSGPPPDWLLEAVARAEAAGRSTCPTEAVDVEYGLGDGGAGPGA